MATQTEVEADAWKMNLGRLDERKKKEQGQTFAENRKNALFLFSPCSFVLPSQHECRLCCVTMFKPRHHRVAMNHEKLHFSTMSTRDPVSMTCCTSFLWLRLAAASSSSHIKRENQCLQVIVHICPLYSQSQWLVSKDSKGQEYRSQFIQNHYFLNWLLSQFSWALQKVCRSRAELHMCNPPGSKQREKCTYVNASESS